MKKRNLLAALSLTLFATGCANRLGDLTLVSNRNYDKSVNYELLQREVQVKVKTKKNDVLERAVDKATSSVPGGEYLQNVSIWVSPSGKKLKLKGDVYGIKQSGTETTNGQWKVGDKVQYKTPTGRKTGEIIDVSDPEQATVKLENGNSDKVKYKYLMKN